MNLPDGWFTPNNIKEYRRLVSRVPKNGTICELGVWRGRSLCSVADIIVKNNLKVFAVDTFKGTESEGDKHKFAKENDLLAEFKKNMADFNLSPEIYEMTTNEASKIVTDGIDLLFIDAGHEYEDVKQDIENWFPKVRGTIAGHDYSDNWKGVKKAVDEKFKVRTFDDIWSYNQNSILAYVSTLNRTNTTLPLCLVSIALQTVTPDHVIIFDDNENPVDLRKLETYAYCFKLLEEKGITFEVIFGKKKGQHHNHEIANQMNFKYNWRIDDDEIAEPTCLEELLNEMKDGVGAVAGLVLQPQANHQGNIQWSKWEGEPKSVESLYSSFLYRPRIANFNLNLSRVAHREETLFTEDMKAKGYDLIVTPKALTWHFRSAGGIRTFDDKALYDRDEDIYQTVRKYRGKRLYVLNNGLGDHYMFLQAGLPLDNAVIACCYPEVFDGLGVELISIADAQKICDIEKYNIYTWSCQNKWTGHLTEAFKKLYENSY